MTTPDPKAARARRVRDQKWRRSTYRVEINGRPVAVNATTAHGTASTYSNWMCRCEPCTTAHRAACAERRGQRAAERVNVDGRLIHPHAPHGTTHGRTYWMCECWDCVAEHNAAISELYHRRRTETDR